MRERYMKAPTFLEYMETVEQNTELWKQIYERVEIADEVLQANGTYWFFRRIGAVMRLI